MDRRAFVATLGAVWFAQPRALAAQPARRRPHIGLLFPLSRQVAKASADALEAGFRDLGYVPGDSITLDYRWAEGKAERLPTLAHELVESRPDMLITVATQATLAAKAATKTLPIVMVYVGDPVGTGIVQSLARPGGNITGIGVQQDEFSAKLPELLKEAFPQTTRIAFLSDASYLALKGLLTIVGDASRRVGAELVAYDVRTAKDVQAAFPTMSRERINGVIVPVQPFTYQYRQLIASLTAKHRLPAIYQGRAFVEAGGLMCYGVSEVGVFRRTAVYADKILKGVRPADLPVEQPETFELLINLKTAKELGLTIPKSLLLRASEVIE